MLEDYAKIRRVIVCCGTVDLRKGINGLSQRVGDTYDHNPFWKSTLFLFCGKKSDRIKGLLCLGTGYLLLYKPGKMDVFPSRGLLRKLQISLRNSSVS